MAIARSDPGAPAVSLPAATTVGTVALTVSDLGRVRDFYERVVGLQAQERADGSVALGATGGPTLVTLHADASAPVRGGRAPGLFHLAIVLPTRADLADALLRVAAARWPLNGASDHRVSEALYLSDPEGNGIELYHDRPRRQWPQDDSGTLRMATLALDLDELVAQAGDATEPASDAPSQTRMGHVHLQVSDVAVAEAFYHGVLGFDVTVRAYPGAVFVSAGGYHHHLGLNSWNSAGAAPITPGARGLRSFEIVLPGAEELDRMRARIAEAGIAAEPARSGDGSLLVHDRSGIAALLRAA